MRWFVLPAVVLLGFISAAQAADDPLRVAFVDPVPPFTLTDQHGNSVSKESLRGKVWVVNFFFSGCAGECNKVMPNLKRLHEELAGWPDVALISISVFPDQDTPELLRAYAKDRLGDAPRWHLLTGKESTVYDLIERGFKQSVGHTAEPKPGYEVDHTFRVLVVDPNGRIRGYVDGREEAEVARLATRVKELVQARYLPRVNATLNGLAGLLLILGYLAVRSRRIVLHKGLMLAALATSAVFLGCYLYYHFAVLRGESTPFQGEGWVRPVYFAILLSHTLLAIVVAPLALTVTYLGLLDRIALHRRLARWTLPLWLYVSVTGVIVYFMLYQLFSNY